MRVGSARGAPIGTSVLWKGLLVSRAMAGIKSHGNGESSPIAAKVVFPRQETKHKETRSTSKGMVVEYKDDTRLQRFHRLTQYKRL
jgi:hypothetical protein